MSERMNDEQFDSLLRRFLAWHAQDTGAAPMASEVAGRISRRFGQQGYEAGGTSRKKERMFKYAGFAIAAAVIVVVALVGLRFLPSDSGVGVGGPPIVSPTVSPSPTPTPSPSPTPTVVATPVEEPAGGVLRGGTYVFHPLGPPDDSLAMTMTIPAGWERWGPEPGENFLGLFSPFSYDPPDGGALGVLRVHSLNGDPCQWLGSADDIEVGPTVDDLAIALTEQAAYEATDPVDVTVDGYEGQRVDLTLPDFESDPGDWSTAVGCDEQSYRIWNAEGFDIHAQGPSNRWHVWILDVEGSRVVILFHDFPDTHESIRADVQRILDSTQIDP